MPNLLLHIGRFFIILLAQGLIFGQLEFELGIHTMIYPLFILMLPFDTRPIVLMLLAFILGIGVDFFMNTFGLHASAAVLVAYIRPELYRLFAPRDGYDILMQPTAESMGYKWFIYVTSITILIHHLWFFFLEYFKWSEVFTILRNTLLSGLTTLTLLIFIQIIFFKKKKRHEP